MLHVLCTSGWNWERFSFVYPWERGTAVQGRQSVTCGVQPTGDCSVIRGEGLIVKTISHFLLVLHLHVAAPVITHVGAIDYSVTCKGWRPIKLIKIISSEAPTTRQSCWGRPSLGAKDIFYIIAHRKLHKFYTSGTRNITGFFRTESILFLYWQIKVGVTKGKISVLC